MTRTFKQFSNWLKQVKGDLLDPWGVTIGNIQGYEGTWESLMNSAAHPKSTLTKAIATKSLNSGMVAHGPDALLLLIPIPGVRLEDAKVGEFEGILMATTEEAEAFFMLYEHRWQQDRIRNMTSPSLLMLLISRERYNAENRRRQEEAEGDSCYNHPGSDKLH